MSTNQAPEVTYAAQVSQTTFLSLPVLMHIQVVGYAGQITKTFISTEQYVIPFS